MRQAGASGSVSKRPNQALQQTAGHALFPVLSRPLPPLLSWVVRPQKSKLRARSEELVCPRGWLIAARSEELVCPRGWLRCGAGRGR